MATIFRKLQAKTNWYEADWLPSDQAPADTAKCLRTTESCLSVFVLENPDVQLNRVVAALALTRDQLGHMDLALISDGVLEDCGIRHACIESTTPDKEVNRWHLDLVELSMQKLTVLASKIIAQGEIKRFQWSMVKAAIQDSLSADYIVTGEINSKLLPSLRRKGLLVEGTSTTGS